MRKRKAGDVFKNDDIDFDHYKQVGTGAFGTVYEGIAPGTVVKTFKDTDPKFMPFLNREAEQEAYMQQRAADVGLAPPVTGMGGSSFSPGPIIEMKDMRDMYETVRDKYGGRAPRSVRVATAQQLGQLALMGIRLEDRNPGNVMVNRFTKRPMQIDFGLTKESAYRGDAIQVRALRDATVDGLYAAGLKEEADIYNQLVREFLEKDDLPGAFDMAKQGFSRLQKIDAARLPDKGIDYESLNHYTHLGDSPQRWRPSDLELYDPPSPGPFRGPDSTTRRRIIQELVDRGDMPF